MGIKIIGTGSYTPDKVLTNVDLEKMVNDFIMASRTITIEEMVGVFKLEA